MEEHHAAPRCVAANLNQEHLVCPGRADSKIFRRLRCVQSNYQGRVSNQVGQGLPNIALRFKRQMHTGIRVQPNDVLFSIQKDHASGHGLKSCLEGRSQRLLKRHFQTQFSRRRRWAR